MKSIANLNQRHNIRREPPFDFIFDYLVPIETEVAPFFGMFAVRSRGKLLLLLRERANEPNMNGIWVATVGDGAVSLMKELPGSLVRFDRKSKKDEWLLIPPDAEAFERSAIHLCDLIVHRDPRIGRMPKPRTPKKK
jgi:hypothetical protein